MYHCHGLIHVSLRRYGSTVAGSKSTKLWFVAFEHRSKLTKLCSRSSKIEDLDGIDQTNKNRTKKMKSSSKQTKIEQKK
ncbi:hypothetical protein U1Q18_052530 [Sarracenia purpurea var. burkii]